MSNVLLIIDVQNDFISGSLPVLDGVSVIPIINSLIVSGKYDYIVASQDWHPHNHGSFASQYQGVAIFSTGELGGVTQVMWPDHCVQGSWGAEFHNKLNTGKFNHIQQKGMDREIDSYSALRDNGENSKTGLDQWMTDRNIDHIDITGIATDYCVKFTALDAKKMLPNVDVRVVTDACRGVDPSTVNSALEEMKMLGIQMIDSAAILIQ